MNRAASGPRQWGRVLRFAALSGLQDFGGTYTVKSWVLGLFLRMVAQVAFFASMGKLLGSAAQVEFLLVGNAVMVAASSSLTVTVATPWERDAGTLPLLVASPSSPLLVLSAGVSASSPTACSPLSAPSSWWGRPSACPSPGPGCPPWSPS